MTNEKKVQYVGHGEWPTLRSWAQILIFGELVRLTRESDPPQQDHFGDLWHDANWLRDNMPTDMPEPWSFIFMVRANGTHLAAADDEPMIRVLREIPVPTTTYRVTILRRPSQRDQYELVIAQL